MTYGTKTKNHTVAAQWQWIPAARRRPAPSSSGSGRTTSRTSRATLPDHPGYINWWKWADYGINGAFPYVDAQKASRQTIQADVSHYADGFLGQHDIKFGVQYTKGRGNSPGRLLPELRQLPLPVPLDAERPDMQSWYGDTGLLFYNYKDTINPFLTVRTGRLDRRLLRRSVVAQQAPDDQPRPPLRPDDDQVRQRARSTTS